jgi:DNA primase small subunit
VYSGRRGIHCWISDQAALALSNESRWALVEYLELVRGGAQSEKRVHTRYKNGLGAMHPMLSEALSTLQGGFSDLVLEDQDCFRSTEGWNKLLKLLPQDDSAYQPSHALERGSCHNPLDIVSTLREKWEEQDSRGEPSSSIDKWEDMRREIKKVSKDSTRKVRLSLLSLEEWIRRN